MLPKKKQKQEKFIQEYLYIEDYYPLEDKPKASEKKEERGVIIIDLMGEED